MSMIDEAARRAPVRDEVDVLVCGAGLGGISAAVSAARAGARVGGVEEHRAAREHDGVGRNDSDCQAVLYRDALHTRAEWCEVEAARCAGRQREDVDPGLFAIGDQYEIVDAVERDDFGAAFAATAVESHDRR